MDDDSCPQLIDLNHMMPQNRDWLITQSGEEQGSYHGTKAEDKNLELRLGPPGDHQDWTVKNSPKTKFMEGETEDDSLVSLGYYLSMKQNGKNPLRGSTITSPWSSPQQGKTHCRRLQFPSILPVMAEESSQPCSTKVVAASADLQKSENKAFSPAVVPNTSQKRTAPAAVVGWPPVRSFRKNLTNCSSSRPTSQSEDVVPKKIDGEKQVKSYSKGLFVKINMDGVPIGRKVDLKAYDSYEKLSSAVDELFRDLLAAQGNSFANGHVEEKAAITGLLDGSGEYTLLYEDNEGDRMLVGDVPWHMFVSTVKRLRVLKSSELSTLRVGSNKQEKMSTDIAAPTK